MASSLPSWYLLTKDLRLKDHSDDVHKGLLFHGEFLSVKFLQLPLVIKLGQWSVRGLPCYTM